MKIHIDFETRSDVDLKDNGIRRYCGSNYTDALCMAYAIDKDPVNLWVLGEEFPIELRMALEDGGTLAAWNANFEFHVWNYLCTINYNWPIMPIERFECTMAQAYAMGLPGKLEDAAMALKLTNKKDMAGNRVMLQLSKPKKTKDGSIVFINDPEKLKALYKYCKQDVEVEREAGKRLRPLSKQERRIWLLDHRINSKGVLIDHRRVTMAAKLCDEDAERSDKKMQDLTGFAVNTCASHIALGKWLKSKGVITESVDKSAVTNLLNKPNIPDGVRKVLELRQSSGKSSVAKLKAMLDRAYGCRIHNMFQYHAATTGRWGGRGVQLQNLPRPTIPQEQIEDILNHLYDPSYIEMFYGEIRPAISNCLRGFLIPESNKKFMASDLKSIEACGQAWLANDLGMLNIFRTHGKLYEQEAANIYLVPLKSVTKEQRQIGKVASLALGYGGGKGAFQAMAVGYGVHVSDERAEEIKNKWRAAHKAITNYWRELEYAALVAVKNKGEKTQTDNKKIKFICKDDFLWMQLPSERLLCYPFPEVRMVKTPWGELKEAVTFMTEDAQTKQWVRVSTHGGVWFENAVQAFCRDILAEAMLRLDEKGYNVVMHVHDEIVAEELETVSLKEFENIIKIVPSWATGLPVGAEGWEGKRYRK